MTAADDATAQTTARSKFLALLKNDILELDLAALDFGIYRILNYRRDEIDAFLDGELPKQIDAALDKLPGKPSEDEQGRIFHHLYTFFARYYDDGDFVTRPRRGRKAAYSVPYNGQDVHFWWATKGSHYVKSGERFSSYVWRDGARAIRIEVADADVEKDNVKGAKRYYLPQTIEDSHGELRVVLVYRPLDKDETKCFDKKRKSQAYDDHEADEDEAIEGRSAQDRILNHWLDGNGPRTAKVPAGVDKALLKKHLARYVAGQTQDFFVHPQLGEFLSGELDYYLKNEFLEIWDRADGDALLRERGKLAVARELGRAIIGFLAAIEDVQAELFEKRKFVLASDWLARVSAMPDGNDAQTLIEEACASANQVNEWLRWLGEKALAKSASAKQVAKRGAGLLKAYPHLCLHSAHFDESFKYRLLGLYDDIEAATGGTLIHSENYAALRTLEYAYRERVKCIYIDPPYNTAASPIAYKNDFAEASWMAMMDDRIRQSFLTLNNYGILSIAIDDAENASLRSMLQAKYPSNMLGTVIVRANPSGRPTQEGFSVSHEYVHFIGKSSSAVIGRMRPSERQASRFSDADDAGRFEWRNLRREGSNSDRAARRRLFYPICVSDSSFRVPTMTWYEGRQEWIMEDRSRKKESVVWPVDDAGNEKTWRWGPEKVRTAISEIAVRKDRTGKNYVYYKRRQKDEGVVTVTTWADAKYSATEHGTALIKRLFDKPTFSYPKSIHAVEDCLYISGASEGDTLCLDYFAGSGTTGHAVINLNREDGGARKFVLVEQAEYFDTVLLPRIAKVIACPEWKDGKPKAGAAMAGKSVHPSTGSGRTDSGDESEHWSTRSPALVEVLRLERYEDSLDALELPSEAEARRAGQMSFADEPLRYVHEAVAGKSSVTLNHKQLAKPFALSIPQTLHGAPTLAQVDVAATALLLLGLHPLRVRDVQRTATPTRHSRRSANPAHSRYLFIEARPNGKPKDLHLLFLRDCDDTLIGEPLRTHAEAEMHWLDEAIAREFGKQPGDYTVIWYNRDAVLSTANGRSLDPEVIRRMLERAPVDRGA